LRNLWFDAIPLKGADRFAVLMGMALVFYFSECCEGQILRSLQWGI